MIDNQQFLVNMGNKYPYVPPVNDLVTIRMESNLCNTTVPSGDIPDVPEEELGWD